MKPRGSRFWPLCLHSIGIRQHPFLSDSYNMEFILLRKAMRKYQEPPFLEPQSSSVVHIAWRIDPVRMGPFVLALGSADG